MIIRALHIPTDWDWVKEHIPLALSETTKGVVCEHEGKLLAATICEKWTDTSVQAHIICQDMRALKHGFHNECFNYIFNQCGREKIIGTVPSDNKKALKINKHLGCKEIFRIEDAFSKGVDAVVFELHRNDCIYLKKDKEAA